jgi:hypothetical protein
MCVLLSASFASSAQVVLQQIRGAAQELGPEREGVVDLVRSWCANDLEAQPGLFFA